MFKFKEDNKKANIIQVKQMLENLMGAIPSLRSMDVGVNFSDEDRAMDLGLISVFESQKGLSAYVVHPEHQKVVSFLKSSTEYSKVVDYFKD
jgi:hypothetical protein